MCVRIANDIVPPQKIVFIFQLRERSNMARAGGAPENLKRFVKGDPRCAEMQRIGAQKRKELNEKRRAIKDDLDVLLKLTLKKGDLATVDDVLSLEEAQNQNVTVQQAINIAMVQRALLGDVQAVQYIRDTVGEKPSDKVELDQSLTIEAWAKKHQVKL